MVVLLDLDGTLINTASSIFKPMKDGISEIDISKITPFPGAIDFVRQLIINGHQPIIISDSHFKYVEPIAKEIFGIPSLSLADKPNSKKTLDFLKLQGIDISNKDNIIVVGDTWLDIELGRSFNAKTILTKFYIATEIQERDGIGQAWNQLKSGPTFIANNFIEILDIISNPLKNLLAAEGIFFDTKSIKGIKLHNSKKDGLWTIFRSLGRQEVGECDKYSIAKYYTEFQRSDRSEHTLEKLALSVELYLQTIKNLIPDIKWDIFSYVADKRTTSPPNKMNIFFKKIKSDIPKIELLKWNENVDGSIRNEPNYHERRAFINKNLNIPAEFNLTNKSVIILDDQFTSGGTAYEVTDKLRKRGATNVLFLTVFFMISKVLSNNTCNKCGKQMQIKIRRNDGVKFYSCTPPQFKGDGCGNIENIE